jgi:hypothetical protein
MSETVMALSVPEAEAEAEAVVTQESLDSLSPVS